MSSLAVDSRDLAADLRELLEDLEPARWPGATACAARLQDIRASLMHLAERTWPEGQLEPVHQRLAELMTAMTPTMPEDLPSWLAFRQRVGPHLDALISALQEVGTPVDEIVPARPPNLIRNVYHVANAVGVVLLVEWILPDDVRWRVGVSVAGALAAWTMEITRRRWPGINDVLMGLFGPVAHPHEATSVNSATWYTTAILVLALFFPLQAGVAGLMVLGLGDPAAAIVGRRFGTHRLANGRSLEGTLAFAAAGFVGAFVALSTWHPAEPATLVTRAAAAAVAGAIAELVARRIDDNLAVPLAAAAALTLVGGLW